MRRTIRLDLAYDGTDFRGWARQRDPSIRTVEGALVDPLASVVLEPVRLSVAGRTDAGVHARGQVASFVTTSQVGTSSLRAAVNGRLAPEVVVTRAAQVGSGFDARRSASAREYVYAIDPADVPDPFAARYRWHRPGSLSVARMRRGARLVVGRHDFASFCRRDGTRSTTRELQRLTIVRRDGGIRFGLRANAFCHQMVRSLVGVLAAVGEGSIELDELDRILHARDRSAAARVAPPHGLTLERVFYGPHRDRGAPTDG